MQKKLHIKTGDQVQVIAGKEKGKQGEVLSIDRKKDRVLVKGLNIVKRHQKPNAANPQGGGIEEKESGIHISNVMLVENGKPVRVGRKMDEKSGKLVRVSKKTGETI